MKLDLTSSYSTADWLLIKVNKNLRIFSNLRALTLLLLIVFFITFFLLQYFDIISLSVKHLSALLTPFIVKLVLFSNSISKLEDEKEKLRALLKELEPDKSDIADTTLVDLTLHHLKSDSSLGI